ncbi:MAG: PqqD family protein [Candidatus Aminicenantales bacterium]
METTVRLDAVYFPSSDVVAREIEGEMIIVPISSGIGDMEDELFTLNESGRAIWDKLDGKRTLRSIAEELAAEYAAPPAEIAEDVIGLLGELAKRRIVVEGRKE